MRGCYSSSDARVVNAHMHELKQAGVTAVVVSWWGRPFLPEFDPDLPEDTSEDKVTFSTIKLQLFFSKLGFQFY